MIGAFSWPSGLGEIAVTGRPKRLFELNNVSGVHFETITLVEKPHRHMTVRECDSDDPVPGLHNELVLWRLLADHTASLNLTKSRRESVVDCFECGDFHINVLSADAPLELATELPEGCNVFRIREMGNLFFVSSDVKRIIEDAGLTNVVCRWRGRY
ncbi:MAG: hypothetical protein K1X57_00500 [Gemmataceae bacterium]|nr:hypothetical protein [Gemmataceae bacterium]